MIGHSIQIIDRIYCEERGETTAIKQLSWSYSKNRIAQTTAQNTDVMNDGAEPTAVIRGKFPEVQLFEGEVYKGGEFAGSDSTLRETLQI